jgi:hypothetical protein
MKKYYLIFVLLVCTSLIMNAQEKLSNGLLFPQFKESVVIKKDLSRANAFLNYNTLEEEMLFVDAENNVLALDDPSSVIAILIDNRRFVFAEKDAFYEEIAVGNDNYFYIRYKSKLISQGKGAGYGGHSETAAITSFGSVQGAGGNYGKLKTDELFETKVERSFYLNLKGKYKPFTNVKMLGKLFKGQKSEIENFAKKEKIDFEKATDVAKIVAYCFGL